MNGNILDFSSTSLDKSHSRGGTEKMNTREMGSEATMTGGREEKGSEKLGRTYSHGDLQKRR